MAVEKLIVDHIDTWTTALQPRSSAGRGSSGKIDLYGIKKLRELILELAVRGKLVPQDPNDEPASELLKRIAAEKTELVKQGKIKKQKPLPEISEEEKPFELPVGWEWVTFSHLGHFFGGKTPSKMKDEYWGGTIPWVTPKDMKTNLIVDSEDKVTPLAIEDGLTKVSPGSILFVARSGILRRIFPVAITSIECTVNQDLKVLSPFLSEISYYIRLMMNGFERYIVENLTKTGTTVESLLFDDFISHPFMIPPFAEQNRILSTVKKLMSLCDQLEQHSLTSLDAHQQLVETLLTTLTDSQNADALAENWARISEHFDTLFTTEASIDALKQTILQLAVMGKLVPQDPNDEPASELLKRIAQEKAQLVKDGKIKKQKPLPPISDKEKPFEVPEGWEWCKFGLISEFINGDRGSNYPNKNEYVVHGIPWINTGHIEKNGTLSITDMNFITEKKFNELRSGKIQSGDLVYCLRGATFGKTAFVKPYESGAIASSLMIIRPFIREMGEYIYNYLISPFGRSQIFRFDNGSAQPNLSANSVMLYAFACPP
ncbi:restriction endonuclease subunit S, partial [Salmonella enterica]|nr:restriction endonuclease subunit S [Salmonella enterica]EIP0229620.1 restriction endonuclease subunit S [Salmonella enterica]EJA8149104.1 restriction endonuclease subunit S [Salmonella enterica subsp. enterica serovar Montevideo]